LLKALPTAYRFRSSNGGASFRPVIVHKDDPHFPACDFNAAVRRKAWCEYKITIVWHS
jgi:hypothetical protein